MSFSSSVLWGCVQFAKSYGTTSRVLVVTIVMAYNIFFSVLLVLQAAFSVMSAGLPRRVLPQSSYGVNLASSPPEVRPIPGRLIVWYRDLVGETRFLGCVNEDGRLGDKNAPSCKKPMHAIYQTSKGAELRTRRKPHSLCGIVDDELSCERVIAGEEPPPKMYLEPNNFNEDLVGDKKVPITFQGLPREWGTDLFPAELSNVRLFTKAQRPPAIKDLLIYWYPWRPAI